MSPKKHSILLVDDDPVTRLTLEAHLNNQGYNVRTEETIAGLYQALNDEDFAIVMVDIVLPDGDGIEQIATIKQRAPSTPVLTITAHGSIERAVEAIREGAYDFLTKPIELNRLTVTVQNALQNHELLRKIHEFERTRRNSLVNMIGGSAAMQVVYHIIENVAPTNASVLITGESGTGKELVAEAIHHLSPRKSAALIDVNCAAIPKDLLESELFGHERSAFTGANKRQEGRFEQANGSTVFLDELAEMDLKLQPKLLRFLQERSFYRVGGKERIDVDVRVIAATNRDPQQAIQDNQLREDLYYRINVVNIPIPPLRERVEDIPLLADFFLKRYAKENGKPFNEISSSAYDALCEYAWPGNVRELQNCIQHSVVLNSGPTLEADMLPASVRSSAPAIPTAPKEPTYQPHQQQQQHDQPDQRQTPEAPVELPQPGPASAQAAQAEETDSIQMPPQRIMTLTEVEQQAINHALAMTHGNVAAAASALEVSTATLYRKIRDYGFNIKAYKEPYLQH